jgi:hypothetical protein
MHAAISRPIRTPDPNHSAVLPPGMFPILESICPADSCEAARRKLLMEFLFEALPGDSRTDGEGTFRAVGATATRKPSISAVSKIQSNSQETL